MLSAHITSFLNFINAQLEETSRGVTSSHHFHNVQCGIENILCLLECNDDATSHPADAPRWYPGGTVALLLREADQRGIDDRASHAGPAVDTPHSVEFSNAQLSPARIRALTINCVSISLAEWRSSRQAWRPSARRPSNGSSRPLRSLMISVARMTRTRSTTFGHLKPTVT